MKRLLILIPLAAAEIAFANTRAVPLVYRAMSKDPAIADAAVARLRARGQRGVDLMVAGAPTNRESIERYRLVLDRVCKQRDCYASKLYWYTDLEQAKAEAKATGKPILALRMLGNLDEDFSCANSRFFRTTLYSNPAIADYMRSHFVLHWQSVRPVPKVTVEFGDGRRLHQTITGNSIHYVLGADGTPLDALPGLYSPKAFLESLKSMNDLAKHWSVEDHQYVLAMYHAKAWRTVADRLGKGLLKVRTGRSVPTAAEASRLTRVKSAAEAALLSLFDLNKEPITDDEWKRIAEKVGIEQVEFDPASIALMRQKAGSPAMFEEMLRNLQTSVAEDTVRNEYDLHFKIHEWLASGRPPALDALNETVYQRLFLTPGSDPWLGLIAFDRFSALPNSGVEAAGVR